MIFRQKVNFSFFDSTQFYKILSCNVDTSMNFVWKIKKLTAEASILFHKILKT